MNHEFTDQILGVLQESFNSYAEEIFLASTLIQYLNIKTRSASRGAKARGSFANIYAIFVLVEDYVDKGFIESKTYATYKGAKYSVLLDRQRKLPFGNKLQNHALNSRMNDEFRKFFPSVRLNPIRRDNATQRYWIEEEFLIINTSNGYYNIAREIIKIINCYMDTKKTSFMGFIAECNRHKKKEHINDIEVSNFIKSLLEPNVDARTFEIVSYAILKYYYSSKSVYFGDDPEQLTREYLKLFKTGRTNANDGGIDFVMKPLGKFFQVTETIDVKKYLLDIDKIKHYPISFVIKSNESEKGLRKALHEGAKRQLSTEEIVNEYMRCIEEIINIPTLLARFAESEQHGNLIDILDEIILQSKVEFNFEDEVASEEDDDQSMLF